MKTEDRKKNDDLMEAYRDISENIRHCGNMQFAQMTIWVAIIAGGIYLLFSNELEISSVLRTSISFAFFLIGVMFVAMNERLCEYWDYYLDRAKEVEGLFPTPETRQYSHDGTTNKEENSNRSWLESFIDGSCKILQIVFGGSPKNPRSNKAGPTKGFISNRSAVRGVYMTGILFFLLFFLIHIWGIFQSLWCHCSPR